MLFWLLPRGSPPGLRWISVNAPTVPPATSACLTTPTRFCGEDVSLRKGVVNALYTTQTSVPLGRSPGRVAPVSGGLDSSGGGRGAAAVGRGREHDVLVVEAVATIGPGVDDPVGGVRAGRGAVGDVHARRRGRGRREPRRCRPRRTGRWTLEGIAETGGREDWLGLGPVAATVNGGGHDLNAGARQSRAELVGEHVGHPVAVGSDGAPGPAEPVLAVDVVGGRGDLLGGPPVTTVGGGGDRQRL